MPFSDDAIAVARLDWCRAGSVHDTSGLSCILRTRMCGRHISNTKNGNWRTSAAPILNTLLEAPSVTAWTPCPEAATTGVCGLLLNHRFGRTLWENGAHAREEGLYQAIHDGGPAPVADPQPVPIANCA